MLGALTSINAQNDWECKIVIMRRETPSGNLRERSGA